MGEVARIQDWRGTDLMACTSCGEILKYGPGGCRCTREAKQKAEGVKMEAMKIENKELWAWIRPLPTDDFVDYLIRRTALATLGHEILGRWPEVTDEGKLIELLKSRIPPDTSRHCVTPNGRRDGHGAYWGFDGSGKTCCAFCKEPI